MKNNCNDLIDLLVCPVSLVQQGKEVPLKMENGMLTSGSHSYPVSDAGIPNEL
jgi:hypothetical protein